MHQAGWMLHRVCSAVSIPARSVHKFTRPGHLRVHFLPAHLVRDNSSFHRKLVPRIPKHRGPRNAKSVSARSVDGSAPSGANCSSSPLTSLKNTVPFSSTTMERADSPKSLYKNLLRLLSSPRTATLPILLDYHELHEGLRSVASYNLLLSLAIRHVAYGTVQFLFKGMTADQISGDPDTEKLKVRWLVRSGRWEHAWLQVTASHPKLIPLALWLEFFHGTKAGPLANRLNAPRANSPQARFQLLMQNLPAFLPNEVKASVRAVDIVVRAMLSLDRPQSALTLATRYFNALPRHVGVQWAEQCVTIIDSLVAFEARKRGLLDFFTARRKLNSLLAIHSSFRPTPKTLYLLLGTLRQAKQCGTVSWQTLTKFKTRWGPQVENRRVRRRVASYAIIERRLDIFDKVFDAERRSRMLHKAGTSEQRTRLVPWRQAPFREIFPRQGYEESLWKMLAIRALKVKLQSGNKKKDSDRVI
ncbi:hypothetical protein B0H19DRAFT_624183 [Mycena capillaripes]|nr:hypothetical protein B0H19DRAFT_624183 [Mycena capillaripes]